MFAVVLRLVGWVVLWLVMFAFNGCGAFCFVLWLLVSLYWRLRVYCDLRMLGFIFDCCWCLLCFGVLCANSLVLLYFMALIIYLPLLFFYFVLLVLLFCVDFTLDWVLLIGCILFAYLVCFAFRFLVWWFVVGLCCFVGGFVVGFCLFSCDLCLYG